MKIYTIALTTLMMHIAAFSYGQQPQNEWKQFEINPQRTIETIITDGVLKRKSDGAILRMSGMNERVSGDTPEEIATNFLAQYQHELGFTMPIEQSVVVEAVKLLNSGTVVRFRQYHQGLRIDKNEVTLKLNRQNFVRSLQNTTVPITSRLDISPFMKKGEAVLTTKKYLRLSGEQTYEKAELMIHIVNLSPVLCWYVNVVPNTPSADWECYIDAKSGEIIEVRNSVRNIDGVGNVFKPSPTYSAGVPYGTGNFIDGFNTTNSDLDGEMVNVTLKDIEEENGIFRLNGPYASIDDPSGLFDQASSDFSFTREQFGFEAAMCYYYIDQSMRYINEEIGVEAKPMAYEGGVKYIPHVSGFLNAEFLAGSDKLRFGDGTVKDVDSGEDASIILHELMHGVHYWLTNGDASSKEGLGEGLSDYWGASGTRECRDGDTYKEWEREYHQVQHWGLLPSLIVDRTTNHTADYCGSPGGHVNDHSSGQWLSTALTRIFSDLGKFKTDQLVIETTPLLSGGGTGVNLQQAGEFLFETAIDLNYSDNDLCIIYQHLDDVLCIGGEETFVPAPTGNMGNVYMKDTECDNGEEVNPDNGPMWLSEDIWVRHEQDGELEHQNPEYKADSPNWVYARIRGIGCNELNDAQLRLYFSKASTGLVWPTMWNEYYLTVNSEQVLAGDEITTTPVDIPSIAPGKEWIVSIPWYPPNPEDFDSEKHHFCLLGRIISEGDPMFITETSATNHNARNNNNIAWKNISVFDNDPNNVLGPIAVYLGCDEVFQGGHLEIQSAQNSLGKSILELGNVYVELKEPLKSEWINEEMPGNNFTLTEEGYLEALNEAFRIEGINIEDCSQYVNVYFEPFNQNRFAAFDLVQFDTEGALVGGERFEFRPETGVENRSNKEQEELTVRSDVLRAYPNPASSVLNITMKDLHINVASIEIFDIQGRKITQTVLSDDTLLNESIQIDVTTFYPGLYFLVIKDGNSKRIDDLKFIKE